MNLSSILALIMTVSKTVLDDLWHWFLTNFNTALIVTAVSAVSRILSRKEHKETARELAEARAELAKVIASKAAIASAQSSKENANIITAIAENTAISTQAAEGAERAFHEANSVNTKIQALNKAQNDLQAQQNDMQSTQSEGQSEGERT